MQTASNTASFDIGTGDPVLAVHSSASSKSQWRPLAATLGSRYRVIGVDLHGYGGNPLPSTGPAHRLEDEVDLVAARAIEALGTAQPMHVVGHSYGGAVALSLARLRPELVRSLTLFEPVCMNLLERYGPHSYTMRFIADHVAACVEHADLSEAARTFIDYWGGPGSYDRFDLEERKRLDQRVRKVPLDYAALSSAPASPAWYAAIAVPTLLMAGSSSLESARTIARILSARIPRAQLVELPGDHLLPMRNPAVVDREIARFLGTFSRMHETPRASALEIGPVPMAEVRALLVGAFEERHELPLRRRGRSDGFVGQQE